MSGADRSESVLSEASSEVSPTTAERKAFAPATQTPDVKEEEQKQARR